MSGTHSEKKVAVDWYRRWFSSPYYPILYKNRDAREAQIFLELLTAHLKVKPAARILDLACGAGRHSFFLALKGFEVTGIDLSAKSIREAKKHCQTHHRDVFGKTLHFQEGDMRVAVKKNYFDVILNLFTSFGYFEDEKDDERVLKAVHAGLKPNGIFVLDFMNVKKAISGLCKKEIVSTGGLTFEVSRSFQNNILCKKIRVKGKTYEERVKALTREDFEALFFKAGLCVIEIFGDYELTNFDENISDRLIFIVKKRMRGAS